MRPKTVALFVPLSQKLSSVAVLPLLPMCIDNPKGSFVKETKAIDLTVTVFPLSLPRILVRHDNVRLDGDANPRSMSIRKRSSVLDIS